MAIAPASVTSEADLGPAAEPPANRQHGLSDFTGRRSTVTDAVRVIPHGELVAYLGRAVLLDYVGHRSLMR